MYQEAIQMNSLLFSYVGNIYEYLRYLPQPKIEQYIQNICTVNNTALRKTNSGFCIFLESANTVLIKGSDLKAHRATIQAPCNYLLFHRIHLNDI